MFWKTIRTNLSYQNILFKILYILTTSYIDEAIKIKCIMHWNRGDACEIYKKESVKHENLNNIQTETKD